MTYNELKRIITDNELYTQNEEANEMIEQKGDHFVLSLVDRGEMRNYELITDENLACANYLSRIIVVTEERIVRVRLKSASCIYYVIGLIETSILLLL